MEMASETTVVQNGWRKGLQNQRQEALAKAICQQFYQSDRVKQFHRALLQTEALKELDDQLTLKQRMISAAKEETRKFMADLRHKELEAVEQEREKVRRKDSEKKVFREFLTEQMKEQELRRQGKVEKAKEVKECQELCEQFEREKAKLKEQKKEKMMKARKVHTEHLLAMNAIRALEAKKQEMEEERRRFFEMERDKQMMRKQEKRAERRRVAQRYKEMVVGQLATDMREKASQEEELNAKILSNSIAKWESKLQRECADLEGKRQAMRNAITRHRENKRRDQECRAKKEGQSSRDFLNAGKEQDDLFSEMQQLEARKEEEKRATMDGFLRRQMTERRAKDHLRQREHMEFDRKYAELIAEEEEQYQRYTDGIIDAAKKADRNTFALHRAAKHGMWCGVGPISGGMRASYLVPGASYDQMPNYVSTTTKDLQRLYGTEGGQSATRMSFIW